MTISALFSDDFPDLFSVARVPSKTGSRHRQITICPLLQLWQTVNPNQALPRKFCFVFLHTFKAVSTEILLPGILDKGLTCWWHVLVRFHTYSSATVRVDSVPSPHISSLRTQLSPGLSMDQLSSSVQQSPGRPNLDGTPAAKQATRLVNARLDCSLPQPSLSRPAWPDLFFQDFALEIA